MLVFTVSARWVLFLKISRALTNVIFSKFCPLTSIILKIFLKCKTKRNSISITYYFISLILEKPKYNLNKSHHMQAMIIVFRNWTFVSLYCIISKSSIIRILKGHFLWDLKWDDSAVKSKNSSCKGCSFSSHLHGASQPPLTLTLGDLLTSVGIRQA